jgi:hypothetical protein
MLLAMYTGLILVAGLAVMPLGPPQNTEFHSTDGGAFLFP